MYRARQKNVSQVARILFLLLLTTSAWPCLRNSRNLGTILLPGPVQYEVAESGDDDDRLGIGKVRYVRGKLKCDTLFGKLREYRTRTAKSGDHATIWTDTFLKKSSISCS